ncbi:MAG: helix-turn-helix transcriptional regulator [Pseudomonadota bacterium]
MSGHTDDLIPTIECLYRVVAGHATWQDVLDELAKVTPDCGLIIHGMPNLHGYVASDIAGTHTEDAVRQYTETYYRISPWLDAHRGQGIGEVYLASDFQPDLPNAHPQFFEEWAKPNNCGAGVAIKVHGTSGSDFGILTIDYAFDAHDRLDGPMSSIASQLSPHLVGCFKSIEGLQKEGAVARSLLAMLERSDDACFVLDRCGKVLAQNATATSALNRARGVCVDATGRLRLHVPRETEWLRKAVCNAASRKFAWPGGAPHTFRFRAPSEALEPNTVSIMALPMGGEASDRLSWMFEPSCHALVTIRYRADRAKPSIEDVRISLGLTRAEAIVAIAFSDRGGTAKEIAEELGSSPVTVDNQIKSAMKKTGCHRRYELAMLVSRFARPV